MKTPSPTFLKRQAALTARLNALPNHTPVPPDTFWLKWQDNPRLRQEYLGAFASYVEWQEREAKPKKPATHRYFALHESALRNGSFFRVRIKGGLAQYVNGDFMGCDPAGFLNAGPIIDGLPTTYGTKNGTLTEFSQETAEKLIPNCCK